MSPDDWPEWLPGDWTVQIRKIDQKKVKCYVDPQGHKCYTKPQVLDHLSKINKSTANENTNADGHTNDGSESTPRSRSARRATGSGNNTPNGTDGTLAVAGDGSSSEALTSPNEVAMSNWLPEGWTEEVKIRKNGNSAGTKYRIYTDLATGQKFFSRPQIKKYLDAQNNSQAVVKSPTDDAEKHQSATEVSKSGSVSARFSSDYRVVSRTTVEGLPEGWIKEVRTRKRGGANRKDPFYLDPSSDYAFFSKKDALRYLESGDVSKCVIKPVRRNGEDSPLALTGAELASPTTTLKGTETSEAEPNGAENGSEDKTPVRSMSGGTFTSPDTSRKEGRSISGGTFSSDWLPDGWTVEVLAKATGQKYKQYKETATGKKLYSKPQVLNYLGIADSSNSNKRKETALTVTPVSAVAPSAQGPRPKRSKMKKDDTQNLDFKEEITTSAAEGLPAGWIKETRTKIFATHKRTDPFYTDPDTGYIFRSKLDALRFLETGDVNICAIRPKVKDKDGNEVFVYAHDAQKPGEATTGEQQLLEDKEDVPTAAPMTQVPPRGRGRPPKLINSPAPRSTKRQKEINLETEPSLNPTEDNGTGLNLEKQADDERLTFQIEEAENWTDQCLDFAVKTLTDEILFNGQPASSSLQDGNGEVDNGVKETQPKVN
nr:DNA-binding domain-containing protein [Tanacetum cinerariifolium]